MAALRANPPPPGPGYQELGAKHLVDPEIIKEDFLKVPIGMPRKKVLSLLGKPWRSRREPKPARFWTDYLGGDPPPETATFIQQDWYYPAPPLKRLIDSPYSAWGFELFYDPNDRVVFKRIHPDVIR